MACFCFICFFRSGTSGGLGAIDPITFLIDMISKHRLRLSSNNGHETKQIADQFELKFTQNGLEASHKGLPLQVVNFRHPPPLSSGFENCDYPLPPLDVHAKYGNAVNTKGIYIKRRIKLFRREKLILQEFSFAKSLLKQNKTVKNLYHGMVLHSLQVLS